MSKTPLGEGLIIFDLKAEAANPAAFLSWYLPSPNGHILAVGICDDGSEHNTIRLINVTTGKLLTHRPNQVLRDGWMEGVSWLPDSSGFYFSAFEGEPGISEERMFSYRLTGGQAVVENIPFPHTSSLNYGLVTMSDSGRYHIAHQGLWDGKLLAPQFMYHK